MKITVIIILLLSAGVGLSKSINKLSIDTYKSRSFFILHFLEAGNGVGRAEFSVPRLAETLRVTFVAQMKLKRSWHFAVPEKDPMHQHLFDRP